MATTKKPKTAASKTTKSKTASKPKTTAKTVAKTVAKPVSEAPAKTEKVVENKKEESVFKGFFKRKYDDAIEFYKSLLNNSYFENDWYPYRQLYIIYSRANEKEAALEIIKELFLTINECFC